MRIKIACMLLLGTCITLPAQAQSPPKPPQGCNSAQAHQFDFWVGAWVVHGGPKGDQLQGRSRIERSGNGCWIVEHWYDRRGGEGTSLNVWDETYKRWRQFWVGGSGNVLRLAGGLQDGAMVLEGELPARQGNGVQRQRITWTPHPDGSVSQQWDTSDDGGKTWQVGFLGVYRHPQPEAEGGD